jgi:hypothetical protein
MSNILVNTIKDTGNNILLSSDGSGNITTSNLNKPAFEAHLFSGGDQILTDNVEAKVQFNTEVFDTNGCYDNTTNYRFTPTVAGKYFVYATFRVANNQSSLEYFTANIKKNGSIYKKLIQDDRNNYGFQSSITITAIIDMNGTTDYLEGFAQAGVQGSSINLKSDDKCNSFGAFKIGA